MNQIPEDLKKFTGIQRAWSLNQKDFNKVLPQYKEDKDFISYWFINHPEIFKQDLNILPLELTLHSKFISHCTERKHGIVKLPWEKVPSVLKTSELFCKEWFDNHPELFELEWDAKSQPTIEECIDDYFHA